MDARTGVQRQEPPKPAWAASGERGRAAADAVAIADRSSNSTHVAPGEDLLHGEARLSFDPLRSTDRYRLVMPYAEEL